MGPNKQSCLRAFHLSGSSFSAVRGWVWVCVCARVWMSFDVICQVNTAAIWSHFSPILLLHKFSVFVVSRRACCWRFSFFPLFSSVGGWVVGWWLAIIIYLWLWKLYEKRSRLNGIPRTRGEKVMWQRTLLSIQKG